jgi:hypothetical protein
MPGCLDVRGQKELLAGIALEFGDATAALARCNIRTTGAEKYAEAQEQRALAAEAREVWVPIVAGVLGAATAAAITAGIEAAAHR